MMIRLCKWMCVCATFLISESLSAHSTLPSMMPAEIFPPLLTAAGFTIENDLYHNKPLLLVSEDGGRTWENPLFSLLTLPISGVFEKTSCTGRGEQAVCIAVGSQDEYKQVPLLAVRSSGSNAWEVKSVKNHGLLYGASCTGAGSTAICAAGFQDSTLTPEVLVSQDGGQHWLTKTIMDPLEHAGVDLSAISCTGSERDAICVIVGNETVLTHKDVAGFKPHIVVGTNKGAQWTSASLSHLSGSPLLSDVSCTGSGATATCVAIGASPDTDGTIPCMITSTDGGQTWSEKSVPQLSKGSALHHISCTGTGRTAVCAAVGAKLDKSVGIYSPLLVVSTDAGEHWSVKPIADFVDNLDYSTELLSVNCSNEGEMALCAAVGTQESLEGIPDSVGVMVVSRDGGHTWFNKSVADLSLDHSFFSSVSCTPSQPNTICTAVGGSEGKPIVAISLDGGEHWDVSRATRDMQLRQGVLLGTAVTN